MVTQLRKSTNVGKSRAVLCDSSTETSSQHNAKQTEKKKIQKTHTKKTFAQFKMFLINDVKHFHFS